MWSSKQDTKEVQTEKSHSLDHAFVECDEYMFRTGPRTLPQGINYKAGSDWYCLSRDFIQYLTSHYNDPLLNGLMSVANYTVSATETFFLTALKNSKFCTTHFNSNLRLTNWDMSFKKGCHCYRPSADWCGCSPLVFTAKDLDRIKKAKNKFFGRKFDATMSTSVLNVIDRNIFGINRSS